MHKISFHKGMSSRNKKSRKPQEDWWYITVPQHVEFGTSEEARRRHRNEVLRMTIAFIGGTLVFVFLVWLGFRIAEEMKHEENSFSIVRLEYQTDGALEEEWVRKYTGLTLKSGIQNPIELRRKLENYPQILEAQVSRDDKDLIKISLRERYGIARVYDGSEEKILSSDGVLFPKETGFAMTQNALPLVLDANFYDDEHGFRHLANGDVLLDFINEVRQSHPALMTEWESISMRDLPDELFSEEFPQPWAVIRVKERRNLRGNTLPKISEIIFSAQNFGEELRLWDSSDTQTKLEKYFQNEKTKPDSVRVVFISNEKNIHNPIPEIRIIPNAPQRRTR